jgi:hypothetical protein
MIEAPLVYLPVGLLAITALFLLVNWNWRAGIVALAVQFLAVFWLTAVVWPLGLAVVKLVAGWMAGAILGASQPGEEALEESVGRVAGGRFRLAAALLVILLVFSILPTAQTWLPVPEPVLLGGLLLLSLGLLQLGMTVRPLRIVLGLLTILSGFELLYAVLESSVLLAGLLAVVNLGLALVGAYLLEESAPEPSS